MNDQRFAHVKKDPKFRRIPKAQSKIKIDKRFQSMFTDKKFQVKYSVDKRGRPVNHQTKEDLERYYEISSEEDEASSDEESKGDNESEQGTHFAKAPKDSSSSENENSDNNDDNANTNEKSKSKNDALKSSKYDRQLPNNVKDKLKDLKVDYARGEQTIFSDSSSDDEETDEDIEKDEIDHRHQDFGWFTPYITGQPKNLTQQINCTMPMGEDFYCIMKTSPFVCELTFVLLSVAFYVTVLRHIGKY